MKKLCVTTVALFLLNFQALHALTWDECIEKYNKAKQFQDNIQLAYTYLKSTKQCLINFKKALIQNPDPQFSIKAMNENITMLNDNINRLVPNYSFDNTLQAIPKYVNLDINPTPNQEYTYFKRFNQCNGVHAQNRIYTAKHCNIANSQNIQYDLNYIETPNLSNLQVAKLNLNKTGTFKYYSMSKEGEFYNTLLQEKNCKFYKAKAQTEGLNQTLDLTDLTKEYEIRSSCVAIPSNSGGGVFQGGKLVGIISKTVFEGNEFKYSIVEPIISLD